LNRFLLLPALLGMLAIDPAAAGRDPEAWDDLPQVYSFSFSADSVGLVMGDAKRYALGRKSLRLEQLTAEQYAKRFSAAVVPASRTVKETGINSTVLLRTSGKLELTTQDAYCSEGEDTRHGLWIDGKRVSDHVSPCASISAAELVGNQLWLGTRHDGEYGDYPAEGVVVQSMDKGRLLKRMSTNEGLTGNLVRAIRFDPFEDAVWIATNEGINQVDRRFTTLKSLYVQQDVVAEGVAVRLTSTKLPGNPLAAVLRGLKVVDARRFFEATRAIPADMRQRGLAHSGVPGAPEVETAYVPPQMNVLVPFFLEAAQSNDAQARQYALSNLLLFKDPRMTEFLLARNKAMDGPDAAREAYYIRQGLDKLHRYGLIDERAKKEELEALLSQEAAALGRFRGGRSRTEWADGDTVILAVNGLMAAGDSRGLDMLNAHFEASDGGRGDSFLYDRIGSGTLPYEGLAPAMLAGLRKFTDSNVSRGCRFLSDGLGDAVRAEAILLAMDRRRSPPQGDDPCPRAFRYQFGFPHVWEGFFRDIYPELTPRQKALADSLAKDIKLGPESLY
jgi:hypothetical protein